MTIPSLVLLAVLAIAGFAETVRFTYDEAGRLVRADYANGRSIEYAYDKSGNLVRRVVSVAPATPPQLAPAARQEVKSSPAKKAVPARRDRSRVGGKAR